MHTLINEYGEGVNSKTGSKSMQFGIRGQVF
jgi:hypothetical protein